MLAGHLHTVPLQMLNTCNTSNLPMTN